jgi:hypothetical protein
MPKTWKTHWWKAQEKDPKRTESVLLDSVMNQKIPTADETQKGLRNTRRKVLRCRESGDKRRMVRLRPKLEQLEVDIQI